MSKSYKDMQYWVNTGQVRKPDGSTSSSSTSFNYSKNKDDGGEKKGYKKLDDSKSCASKCADMFGCGGKKTTDSGYGSADDWYGKYKSAKK